jgi:hypothetical protein
VLSRQEGYISDLDQTCHTFPVEEKPAKGWIRILSWLSALVLVFALMPFGLLLKFIQKRRS